MITGIVTYGQAVVNLMFRTNIRDIPIQVVIDTGFTGDICLPLAAVNALKLELSGVTSAKLADNSAVNLPIYNAVIIWHGEARDIKILATGIKPLLGTALLEDSELIIQFTEGGLVSIKPL